MTDIQLLRSCDQEDESYPRLFAGGYSNLTLSEPVILVILNLRRLRFRDTGTWDKLGGKPGRFAEKFVFISNFHRNAPASLPNPNKTLCHSDRREESYSTVLQNFIKCCH